MKNVFEVTDHGLQVDKTAIMPGSTLILSRPAPGHWARFGTSGQVSGKELIVATPAAAADGAGNVGGNGAGNDRETDIRNAISGLDPQKDFTKGGKPEVDAINALMPDGSEPVTAAERDAVMEGNQ